MSDVISADNVDVNKSIDQIPGCNVLQRKVMQTNHGLSPWNYLEQLKPVYWLELICDADIDVNKSIPGM